MTRPSLRSALAALGVVPMACSAPAPAQRGRSADHSAPAEEQASAVSVVVPTSTEAAGPTATTEAPTTTAVTIVLPDSTTTTVRPRPLPVTTLPEHRYDALDDSAWAHRERILACIRSYEGDYGTESGNGYHGAYQFVQSTWDGAAARAGYPAWVGRRAGDAPAHVQDDIAWQLYSESGFGPWPPATRYCQGTAA